MNFVLIFSNLKKQLKRNFDRICLGHSPLLVTLKKTENVGLISEGDFSSLQETIYLCQSPKNLSRLLEALNRKEGHSLETVKNALGL